MRRWNGWGDDSLAYPLPASAAQYLTSLVGAGEPQPDVSQAELLSRVPPSRLPAHPLVSTSPLDRLLHARGQSTPDWIALRGGLLEAYPDGAAFPTAPEQVRQLLQYAIQTGAVVIPYGGGTSVVGHINPLPGSPPVLTVDMSRFSRLLRFEPHSLLATFGAGVSGSDLEAQLRAHGCTLGHYPQSFEYSTLGGWVATRSSGQQSLRYGRIEKLFAGARLESPLGSLELPPFPASAAGPDLRELVLGSEGRLGILTEVTVRLSKIPPREEFHAVFFPDFDRGQAAVQQMLAGWIPLCMLRLSTPVETATTLALAGHENLIGTLEKLLALRGAGEGKCMLILGFSGTSQLVRLARREALGIASRNGGVHTGKTFGEQWHKNRFRTPYLRNELWERGYAVDTLETAVTWEHVPGMIAAIETALHTPLAESGEKVHVFTHLSHIYLHGSSIYTTYLFRRSATPAETLRRWQALKSAASQAVLAQHGTISHQHGVGTDHRPYLAAEKGPLGMAALQALVRQFDPMGMMNPGKLLP